MWANAQRDGHRAEYRWRPVLNAVKFGSCPLLKCRTVMLPKYESARLGGCKVNFAPGRILPRAGSGAVSKWVICACDSLVDFGAV